MVSQKSLSHSSRMWYAAPSLRLFLLPSVSRFLVLDFEMSASSLAEVRAARGGEDGGEGIPELIASGIPLEELVLCFLEERRAGSEPGLGLWS